MGSSPLWNIGTIRPESGWENSVEGWMMMENKHYGELMIEKHWMDNFGISSDEFDKETGSSDGLQPKQADLI
ncbi:hypothetical protein Tco_0203184 [Tanacetum coccineum]